MRGPMGGAILADRIVEGMQGLVDLVEHDGATVPTGVAAALRSTVELAPGETKVDPEAEVAPAAFRSEGRLGLLAGLGRVLTHCFALSTSARAVNPVRLRLRTLTPWVVDERADPQVRNPYYSVLKYLSRPCLNYCRFCLHSNDASQRTRLESFRQADADLDERVRHYDPARGRAIFSATEYHYNEYVNHPRFLEVSAAVRNRTNLPIDIITSGIPLTEECLRALTALKPVMFYISLNAVTPEVRRVVMRDREPERTLALVRRLREFGFPFITSIVHDDRTPLDELERTIRFADEAGTAAVRIGFQGYSRWHPAHRPDWDWRGFFRAVGDRARGLRSEVAAPIFMQPPFLFDRDEGDAERCLVVGVVAGSPGASAGLCAGDVLHRVGTREVLYDPTRARVLLRTEHRLGQPYELTVERDGKLLALRVDPHSASAYPHACLPENGYFYYPDGIVITEGLTRSTFAEMARAVRAVGPGARVLVLASALVEPLLRRHIRTWAEGADVHLVVPRHAFWGGSFVVGDLYVAEDYRLAIEEWSASMGRPDLVLLPATPFGGWGIDLVGQHAATVLREYPVFFVRNNIIPSMG